MIINLMPAGMEMSGMASTLLGALIAGVASFGAAWWTVQDARMDRDATAALRTTTKLKLMLDSLNGVDILIRKMITSAEPELGSGHRWRYVRGLVGGDKKSLNFESDDFIPFVRHRENDIVNALMMFGARYEPTDMAVKLYREQRELLIAQISPATLQMRFDNDDQFNDELFHHIARVAGLNHDIRHLLENIAELLIEGKRLAIEIGPINKRLIRGRGRHRAILSTGAK